MEAGRDNAITKAVHVLSALRTLADGGSARELAATTGVPRSTTQRILTTLEATGMVIQDLQTQRYRVGPQALLIGLGYNGATTLLNEARPQMVALRDETGETVGISIAAGTARVFIDEVQSTHGLRFASELGRMYPLWSGANGRVLLSGMTEAEVERALGSREYDAAVQNPLSVEETRDRLAQIRRDGYAEAADEAIGGISSLAVPINDGSGRVLAALSVSGPSERLAGARAEGTLPRLLAAGEAISARLGGTRMR
ncbi:IclR family transcriptional regulator [Ruania zhangjianzhongii]|uniref:IclR family transcriptional regulator n=1 Tax=Ruania zhangjianzhongii TaxID=2603206 RepID=UPI00143DEFF0|nr:IclR family transcriptional regulator [Ruania zhangjianzhongii]